MGAWDSPKILSTYYQLTYKLKLENEQNEFTLNKPGVHLLHILMNTGRRMCFF